MRPGAVHHPRSRREIILRANQGDDVAARVVDNHHRAVTHILLAQLREPFPQYFLSHFVEPEIKRGLQLGTRTLLRLLQHQLYKMRRAKTTGRRAKRQRLVVRTSETRGVEPAIGVQAAQHRFLPAPGRIERHMGIQLPRIFREPSQKRSFRVAQVGNGFAEIIIRRGSETDVQVSKIDSIEIGGEDLIFRPDLFETERRHALDQLCPERARPALGDLDELLGNRRCPGGDSTVA